LAFGGLDAADLGKSLAEDGAKLGVSRRPLQVVLDIAKHIADGLEVYGGGMGSLVTFRTASGRHVLLPHATQMVNNILICTVIADFGPDDKGIEICRKKRASGSCASSIQLGRDRPVLEDVSYG
jgi:hypothetical protein